MRKCLQERPPGNSDCSPVLWLLLRRRGCRSTDISWGDPSRSIGERPGTQAIQQRSDSLHCDTASEISSWTEGRATWEAINFLFKWQLGLKVYGNLPTSNCFCLQTSLLSLVLTVYKSNPQQTHFASAVQLQLQWTSLNLTIPLVLELELLSVSNSLSYKYWFTFSHTFWFTFSLLARLYTCNHATGMKINNLHYSTGNFG